MDKDQVVRTLKEMGDLLEIGDANTFEIMAYRNGMRRVDDFEGDLEEAVQAGTLTKIDGIGKGLAKVISELVRDGRSDEHEEIKGRFPPGLPEMLKLRGIGPKKVKVLWTELGVANLDELEAAAREQKVSALKGFGKKTEENIIGSIEWRRNRSKTGRKVAPSAVVTKSAAAKKPVTGSGRLLPGTSGYSYKEWKPAFYPKDVPATRFLPYYAQHFGTVELNNSFYRFPTKAALAKWGEQTPEGFLFAVKANMRITHRLRLKNVEQVTADFVERCETLGNRLGPILYQLPPNLKRDDALLDGFLACLPTGYRHAMEFRHETWVDDAVFAKLADKNVALVVHDGDKAAPPRETTASFTYVRLRQDGYDDAALASWGTWFAELIADEHDVFAYLKHKANTSPLDVLGRWPTPIAAPRGPMAASAKKRRAAKKKRKA